MQVHAEPVIPKRIKWCIPHDSAINAVLDDPCDYYLWRRDYETQLPKCEFVTLTVIPRALTPP